MVSIDGTRQTMVGNRGWGRQDEEWGRFESNLSSAIELGVIEQFRMTVAPGQTNLGEDLRFIDRLGHIPIKLATATNVPWSAQQMEDVYSQVETFYVEIARSKRLPPIEETNDLLLALAKRRRGTSEVRRRRFCQAGDQLLAVDTEGQLLLCHRMTHRGKDFGMGDLWTGVDHNRRSPFIVLKPEQFHHPICETCYARPYCPGSCMAANKDATNEPFYPEERHCLDLRSHVSAVERIMSVYDREKWPAVTKFMEEGCLSAQPALAPA
jgi:radical SAM protein with 4Fe4S-binding SPASM domain